MASVRTRGCRAPGMRQPLKSKRLHDHAARSAKRFSPSTRPQAPGTPPRPRGRRRRGFGYRSAGYLLALLRRSARREANSTIRLPRNQVNMHPVDVYSVCPLDFLQQVWRRLILQDLFCTICQFNWRNYAQRVAQNGIVTALPGYRTISSTSNPRPVGCVGEQKRRAVLTPISSGADPSGGRARSVSIPAPLASKRRRRLGPGGQASR